jgi:hypothetical protein
MKRKEINRITFPEIWFYFFFLTENKDIALILTKETFGDILNSDYPCSNSSDYLNCLFHFAMRNCQVYMQETFGQDPYTERNYLYAEVYARLCAGILKNKLKDKRY